MTRADFEKSLKVLPAFKGFTAANLAVYVDLALQAVEGYAPKRVLMVGIPSDTVGGSYAVPTGAGRLLGAFVSRTNARIEMREQTDAKTGDRTYILLQIQVPSWLELVRDTGVSRYPSPYVSSGYRWSAYAGSSYSAHDLSYTVALKVDDLEARQLLALRLYAESEAYQEQALRAGNVSDLVDREASGASTTIRRSQSGVAYQKLAMQRSDAFKREIARPYWSVDTFGITEYLWGES